ncbi:hypothetical protein C1645_873718 [Glomus cerebriforme]|uniref:FAR-17a/AIG1-like protein n=1 Tax=Glomus cerebriforme TaxID=658196 RepID=A0A397TCI2_9GLOM|nr:hypothetical protein C1645_873718 [Glomus cerebriforme]
MKENKIDNNKSSKIKNFFHCNDFDETKSLTSWFISPKILFIFRGIIFLYSWIVLIGQFVNSAIGQGAGDFFKFFTNLSFIGLTAYFTTAFYHSYRHVTKKHKPLSNQSKILNWLFWLLYHTTVHFSMLIVLTYWLFLSQTFIHGKPPPFRWWLNVSVHGLNFLFTLIEVFLNRQRMVVSFIIFNLIILILYIFIGYINYAVNSQWVYGFLNYNNGYKSALWYIGLFISYTIIYFIMYGIHSLRDYIGKRFGRYKHEHKDDSDSFLPI